MKTNIKKEGKLAMVHLVLLIQSLIKKQKNNMLQKAYNAQMAKKKVRMQ